MSNEDINDLRGDESRRANDPIRGFRYQLWQTVDAWISIQPGELLYVEGAEDYDVVVESSGRAVQVKDTKRSGALTLGSPDAIKALNSYWAIRKMNQGRGVQYKYITTSLVGNEKVGFGKQGGVEIWNRCRHSKPVECIDDLERIAAFLLKKTHLEVDIRNFIQGVSPEVLWSEVICPCEWLYEQPDVGNLQQIVIGRLHSLGRDRGMTAQDAKVLASKLYMKLNELACSSHPESVDYLDLHKEIDKSVCMQVPRNELSQVVGGLVRVCLSDSMQEIANNPGVSLRSMDYYPPVLREGLWRRERLLADIATVLEAGVVYIHGGIGVGKTTLALQSLGGCELSRWIGFRNYHPDVAHEVLKLLLRDVGHDERPYSLVLDDFNPGGDIRVVEEYLCRLSACVREKCGSLIVTSYAQAGPRYQSALGLMESGLVCVPYYSEDELGELLEAEGCPSNRVAVCVQLLWMHTSGHPTLVHARMNAMKRSGYQADALPKLLETPREIGDARDEALRVARSTLSGDSVELLCRLSLSTSSLKPSQILHLCDEPPAIQQAGQVLHDISGVWLDDVGAGRRRVTALLAGACKGEYSSARIKSLHSSLSRAFLSERAIGMDDYTGAVIHGLMGEDERQLACVSQIFLTADESVRVAIADALRWVSAVGVGPDVQLPIEDVRIRRLFRLFQYDVAYITDYDGMQELIRELDSEFAIDSGELDEVLSRMAFIVKLLIGGKNGMGPEEVTQKTVELWSLIDRVNAEGVNLGIMESESVVHPDVARNPVQDMYAISMALSVESIDDIQETVRALDAQNADVRNKLLASYPSDDSELRMLFMQPWARIDKDNMVEFQRYADIMNDAIEAGRNWGSVSWVRAAARALSANYDECLGRHDSEMRILDEVQSECGSSASLDDQRAIVHYNKNDYREALKIWRRILPEWKSDELFHDRQPLYSTRHAAIAAAEVGDYGDAALLYMEAYRRSKSFGMDEWRIGLLGDVGYVQWLAGDIENAVIALSRALEDLEGVNSAPENFPGYAVRVLVGHILAYITNPAGLDRPWLGMCSQLEPDRRIAELEPKPLEHVWYLLGSMAQVNGATEIADHCRGKYADSPYAYLRAMATVDVLKYKLGIGELDEIVSYAVKFTVEMDLALKLRLQKVYKPDPEGHCGELTNKNIGECIMSALWAGMLVCIMSGRGVGEVVEMWMSRLGSECEELRSVMRGVHDMCNMGSDELSLVMRDTEQEGNDRITASVLLMGQDDIVPREALYSQVLSIFHLLDHYLFGDVYARSVSSIVRQSWLRLIKDKGFLMNPGVTSEAIESACRANQDGWGAAVNIVLAAAPSVDMRIPPEVLSRLQGVAGRK